MPEAGAADRLPAASRPDSWIRQPGHGGSAMDTVMRHIAAKERHGANGITAWLRQGPETGGSAITPTCAA
ncbi:hypothetical protein [Paenibacillus sp. RC84]|uniref:hypothetical protein n=1 Tax=Paenibacillus sp. RC84 TaxID=3156252 RepID=UPI003519579E